MTEAQESQQETRIKVIGIGHGGGDAVEHMLECGVQGVEFICVHTGAQAQPNRRAHRTTGLGRNAAAAAMQEIRAVIADTQLLFITAAMDGAADTQAAVAMARAAEEMGILTVGLAGMPCKDIALAGLEAHVDALIVARDGDLRGLSKGVVGEMAAILNEYGHVNVDLADVRTVMRETGKAVMGSAQASGPDRSRIAATQAVQGLCLSQAKAMLVLVTAAKGSLKLSESRLAMGAISACSSPHAHVIYGAAHDDSLGDSIRVTVVATGLASAPL